MEDNYKKVVVPISSFIDSKVLAKDNAKKLLYKILEYRKNKMDKMTDMLQSELVIFYTTATMEERDKTLVNSMDILNEYTEILLKMVDDITQYEKMICLQLDIPETENKYIIKNINGLNSRLYSQPHQDSADDSAYNSYIY